MTPVTRSQTLAARGEWIRSVMEEPVIATCILEFLEPEDIRSIQFVLSGRFREACAPFVEIIKQNKKEQKIYDIYSSMMTITKKFVNEGPIYENLSPTITYLKAMSEHYDHIHMMGLAFITQLIVALRRLAERGSVSEPENSQFVLSHTNIIESHLRMIQKYYSE